ncbi:MAG: YbjN domain-containing protein [Candidatus Accumulibacter sp.]|jgi:hypothetical protein|nr:YbjN domain-containing protein [Accumulibacter sp.]
MNPKAEKFSAMLTENKIGVFEISEVKDELQSVVYRSAMEVGGQRLPVVVIIDQSIFVIVRTIVASNYQDNEKTRAELERHLNELNGQFKIFKYYTKENNLILDMCLPASDASFDPNIIRVVLDLAIKHLTEVFPALMEIIWGKKQEAVNPPPASAQTGQR